MFHFGKASTRRLQTCHRDIQAIMHEALAMSDTDMTIVCGYRGAVEQNAAFNYRGPNGERRSYARFGESPHNFEHVEDGGAVAVDVAPYKDGRVQWGDQYLFSRIADFIMAANEKLLDEGIVKHRLEQIGDWDKPHWQLENWKDLV